MGAASVKDGERKGDFLAGKYLLEDCLGVGGMGEVYRATNVSLGRTVAVKVLNKEHTGNEDDVLRFLREARAAAAVRHPNVVDVFDVARDDDGTPFIVQELLSGQDLEQYLGASGGRLSPAEALEIMIPVADAVAAAHARDVVHRDLKPANIFLAREGNNITPKVLDFGACLYQTVGELSAKEQRIRIGTPHYMAPEQISVSVQVDARADVWALGVILYELLVGVTPFEAENAADVLKLVRRCTIAALRAVAPEATEPLERVVARCLDRDRNVRFADAAALRDELQVIRSGPRATARSRSDTMDEDEIASSEPRPGRVELAPANDRPRNALPASRRVPSLVLTEGVTPKKRRGSSLLTLSSPDDDGVFGADPPRSESKPVELVVDSRAGSKPARTAADVIREAEAAAPPAAPRSPRASAQQPAARESAPSLPTPKPRPAGDLGIDLDSEPLLELDVAPPASRQVSDERNSSMPPVLDPRAAAPRQSSSDISLPPSPGAVESAGAAPRSSQAEARESSLTPPLSSALRHARRPSSAYLAEPQPPWTTKTRLTLAASIVVPATAMFVALRFAPVVHAPLGRAMRGDSPLASGALAVLALVAAAVLASRALGSSRSPGNLLATVGAVLLGVVMIIVTFSAIEAAESGLRPDGAAIVPFIAPLVPLGLGLAAFAEARRLWRSPFDRSDAIRFVALTSLMLFALLELGPLGAVQAENPRAVTSTLTGH